MTNKVPKKKRGRPKTLNRQRTIALAMTKYWKDGVESTSLNEICHFTQVSKPGVYREFGGEDGLMEAVLDHYKQEVFSMFISMLKAERPFAETLEGLMDWITHEDDTPQGCLFVKMRSAKDQLGPATTQLVESIKSELRSVYKTWYQRGIKRQEVNPDIHPELAAFFIETQITTALHLVTMGEPIEQIKAQTLLAFESILIK